MAIVSRLGIVVGNPKPRSRTLDVARVVARAAADAVGIAEPAVEIDLADLAGELFDWSSTTVREATEAISRTALAVVASPTYKATYTGLLKSFLDWYSTTGLDGVTVVPVMVGAASTHALAVEVHLRPVLVEIGGSMPTRGLFVTEDQIPRLASVIDEWLVVAAPLLRSSVLGGSQPTRD
jgi:FMN reductase